MPPTADLPGFLHGVAPILDRWGYTAVAALIGVESFGVPAPGQTLMVAAAIYAGAGRLNIYAVAAVAFIAAVIGDNIGYWIGLRGGRKAIDRWGKYVFLTPERLEKAENFFARRGGRVVMIARFIDGLRQFNGVIAGITNMPWRTFLLFNAIGAALWVGWWTTVAYIFGTHLVEIIEHAHKYKWWAIAVIVLAVGTYVWLHVRHIKKRRAKARDKALAEASSEEPTETPVDISSETPSEMPEDQLDGNSDKPGAPPASAELTAPAPAGLSDGDVKPETNGSPRAGTRPAASNGSARPAPSGRPATTRSSNGKSGTGTTEPVTEDSAP